MSEPMTLQEWRERAEHFEAEARRLRDREAMRVRQARSLERESRAACRREAWRLTLAAITPYVVQEARQELWLLAGAAEALAGKVPQRLALQANQVAGRAAQLRDAALRADPEAAAGGLLVELRRLRQVVAEQAAELHRQRGPRLEPPGVPGVERCVCPGCRLVRALDLDVPVQEGAP